MKKIGIIKSIKNGDWGLGPIPNPQSPIPIKSNVYYYNIDINKKNLFIKK